jgi:hypothetical protein
MHRDTQQEDKKANHTTQEPETDPMEVSDIEENLMEENIENNIFEIIESY